MNRPAGTDYYHNPRGSWFIKQIYALDGSNKIVPRMTDTDVNLKIEVTEPLLLSPFIFGSGHGNKASMASTRYGHEWGQREQSVAECN